MTDNPAIQAILDTFDPQAIRLAIESAYLLGRSEGFAEGQAVARDRILQLLDAAGPPPLPIPPGAVRPSFEVTSDIPPPAKRAPKGLTQQVIDMIIEEQPGLSAKEIADRAVTLDDRISPKTVYNTLLGQDRYVQRGDGWHSALAPVPTLAGEDEMRRREGDG